MAASSNRKASTGAEPELGICFFISPIGGEKSPERKRADDVFKYVIAPAAEEFDLKPVRADKIEKSGNITTQVIEHLVEARIVVADFWGSNPNVFYELAVRHVLRAPVIHLYIDEIPFDVHQMRAVRLDHQDLDSVEQAKAEIRSQMKTALKEGFQQETPISVALDVQKLQSSESNVERRLGEMYTMLESLLRRSTFSAFDLGDESPGYLVRVGPPGEIYSPTTFVSERSVTEPVNLALATEPISLEMAEVEATPKPRRAKKGSQKRRRK